MICTRPIGIINNGLGNVGSVKSAFEFYGYPVTLLEDSGDLRNVSLIVLAGVGSFGTAVRTLRRRGLWKALEHAVREDETPVLGLCLGMQLFADQGYEDGEERGFGWVPGRVVKIRTPNVKVPHIGWDRVEFNDPEVFRGMRYHHFYYMHSYHFVPEDPGSIIATTQYGDDPIVAGVRRGSIIGLQFHPEKSQSDGLRVLRNVVEASR